jgi:hypothetical protein
MASIATKQTSSKNKISSKSTPGIIMESEPTYDVEERLEYIAKAAYYKAASRGFVPGEELDDWLEAEAEYEEMKEI